MTSNSEFKITPLLNVKYLRNGTRYRHSYKERVIRVSFRRPWPWVT